MSLPVHLVESLAGVSTGATVTVTGDEAHHAVAVRRLREGERLQLTDGLGTRVEGTVSATGKRVLEVLVDRVEQVAPSVPSVTVLQAIPKGERGELAVEVLTEVGVDRIVPWAASRSVAVWRGDRAAKSLARWRSTAREAAKQSRRAWFPEVLDPVSTEEAAGVVSAADLALVLHEEAAVSLAGLDLVGAASIVVVVGPEGGITDAELASLTSAGAHAVRLGPEVLRTSTAGVAAVAALLARTARWA